MKIARLIIILGFVLAIANCPQVFAQATAGSGPAQAGPLAEVPEKSFDFGILSNGKTYVHNFVVKNVGTAPLKITDVIKI